jgi:hypothetical protein
MTLSHGILGEPGKHCHFLDRGMKLIGKGLGADKTGGIDQMGCEFTHGCSPYIWTVSTGIIYGIYRANTSECLRGMPFRSIHSWLPVIRVFNNIGVCITHFYL